MYANHEKSHILTQGNKKVEKKRRNENYSN